ncbi:hypothetical protein M422DRAFT_247934 [Sphaerobolus stellatus SS14]|nr:hypothetical protein M422DRAFT_247934 [Sphaerobolus stellatus SS14]
MSITFCAHAVECLQLRHLRWFYSLLSNFNAAPAARVLLASGAAPHVCDRKGATSLSLFRLALYPLSTLLSLLAKIETQNRLHPYEIGIQGCSSCHPSLLIVLVQRRDECWDGTSTCKRKGSFCDRQQATLTGWKSMDTITSCNLSTASCTAAGSASAKAVKALQPCWHPNNYPISIHNRHPSPLFAPPSAAPISSARARCHSKRRTTSRHAGPQRLLYI